LLEIGVVKARDSKISDELKTIYFLDGTSSMLINNFVSPKKKEGNCVYNGSGMHRFSAFAAARRQQ
jgi:hypothetical protein